MQSMTILEASGKSSDTVIQGFVNGRFKLLKEFINSGVRTPLASFFKHCVNGLDILEVFYKFTVITGKA